MLVNRNFLRNSVSNYAGKIINIGTWFLLTPFLLSHLGDTTYGLWVLVSSVAAYGAVFDFGIANAVVKYVAEYRAKGQIELARRLIATALCLYTFLGFIVFAIFLIIAPFFSTLFNVPPEQQSTATLMVILAGIGMGLAIPSTTAPAVLRGLQRFDVLNLVTTIGTFLYAVGSVIVVLGGGGGIGLIVVSIVVNLVTQIPNIWFIYRIVPELQFGWGGASLESVRTVASFSWTLFLLNLNGYLETKTDEIVVGANLLVSAVAPYNVARKLATLPQMLTEQFLSLILPLASVLDAQNDQAKLRALYIVSTRLTLAIFVPFMAILIIWADTILSLWVGSAYAGYAYLASILTLASIIDTSQWPAGLILQGMTRHKLLAIMSLGSGISNLILSLVLIRIYGLAGVAIGTLIPTTIVCIGFVLPYTMRQLGIGFGTVIGEMVFPVLVPTIPMMALMFLVRSFLGSDSAFALCLAAGLGILLYVITFLAQKINLAERQAFYNLTVDTLKHTRSILQSR